MSKSEIYFSLPKAVCDVSDLIGIQPGTSKKTDDENSIYNLIPKKDIDEDFKYKVYNLKEIIDKNKSSKNSKRKYLNSKQKKALFNLKNEKLEFRNFEEINKLWHSYFGSILNETKTKVDELKLTRIDLHGAYVIVCSSINTSVVGIKGYILQESKNIFRILNRENKLLTIPKCGTVFAFEHNGKLFKINGYNIMMSSFNRSKMKPKYHYICDL